MSQVEQQIKCRRCQQVIPATSDACPNCGASIRSTGYLLVGAALGLVLVIAAAFNLSQLWPFGLLGLFLAGTCGYLIYDKRQRMTTGEPAEAEPILE